jgi:hypothetical protein
LEYKRFVKVLCDHFKYNKNVGGVVDTGLYGDVQSKLMELGSSAKNAHKTKGFKEIEKGTKKKPKVPETYVFRLDDGMPHACREVKSKDNTLHADGKNSKYLGKSNIRNATRPQKFRKVNCKILKFFCENEAVFKNYDLRVDKAVIVEGCYNTNSHVLQRQLIPEDGLASTEGCLIFAIGSIPIRSVRISRTHPCIDKNFLQHPTDVAF